MSGRPVIDSVEFARLASRLTGEVPVADLSRLHDDLVDRSGQIEYELTGYLGPQGQPGLHLKLAGGLTLRCQRCLQPLAHSVTAERRFMLVRPGDPDTDLSDEDEAMEHVPADPQLDVVGLVEEELVLSLPIATMHPPGQCEPISQAASPAGKVSPFSVLAALKRDSKS
jgi:uncharacterized protein